MADQDFKINVITTANTAGVQQTTAAFDQLQAKIAATKKAAETPTGSSGAQDFGRDIGRLIGLAGAGAVYKFFDVIKQSAAEIEKTTVELQKQANQISENAQKFSEMAKFATTTAGVIKIGEGALKGVETAHKNLLDLSQKELTIWQKIADIWAAGFKDKGPIKQALELQQAQAAQNYQMERTNAIHEITAAQYTKDALASKSYTERVEYLTGKIKEQQDIQKRVGVANIEDYLKAGKEAENYAGILADVNNQRRAEISQAGDRTKAILKNEELERESRKYGRMDQAEAFNVGTRYLKATATDQELAEYNRLSGRDDAEIQTKKRQAEIDKELERQRSIPTANYKTAEQIARESRERIDAEANAAAREKTQPPAEQPAVTPPAAKPSPAPTPSPDVVTAIHELGDKFDRYWS